MNPQTFLKEQVALFQDFSAERLQQLVDGSRVVSFEANEAIAHRGEEATHFGVVLERHGGCLGRSAMAARGNRWGD